MWYRLQLLQFYYKEPDLYLVQQKRVQSRKNRVTKFVLTHTICRSLIVTWWVHKQVDITFMVFNFRPPFPAHGKVMRASLSEEIFRIDGRI